MIITGLTATRMLAIEASSVVSGAVVGNNLILTKHDGSTINAGNVRGAQGVPGDVDRASVQTITGAKTFSSKVTITTSVNGSALRIGGTGGSDALNISPHGASAVTLAAGSEFDGTTSTARATSAGQIEIINGVFNFYMDTGLTSGVGYTRTQRVSFDNAGRISINRATAGVSLLISEQAASLEAGSLFISRSSPASNVQSLVFGAGVAIDYIIGRSAGSDHLQFGTSTGGAAFVPKIQFDTNGGIAAKSDSLFGQGSFGAAGAQVRLKGDGVAAYVIGELTAGNGILILQPQGTGELKIRDGSGGDIIRIGASKLSFFGNVPMLRPSIGGSRAGNAALASLLTNLQSMGLIIDSTSA